MHQDKLHLCEQKVSFLLQQCFKKKDVLSSCIFHSFLVFFGLDSIGIFQDQLIRAFASCGSLEKCKELFRKSIFPSLYTWNAIMEAHVKLNSSDVAIDLFNQLKQENIDPDKFSYLPVLKACSRLQDRRQGMLLHEEIICKGLEKENLIVNTLVDVYAKSGSMEDARIVFNNLTNKDVVTWNVMIRGYVETGFHIDGFKLVDQMIDKGIMLNEITYNCLLKACSNKEVPKENKYLIHDKVIRQGIDSVEIVRNSILDTYGRCGNLGVARRIFDRLKIRDLVSWNTMFAAYSQHGQGWMALHLFDEMQNLGQNPDKVSFSSILQACGSVGAFEYGMLSHCHIVMSGMECDVVVAKMLVDMYAKCGKLSDACKLFKDLRKKDVVPWNSIIAGYSQQGDSVASLILYEKMQREGVKPNDVTYLWVLKACMEEGDIEEGKVLHGEIVKFGLELNTFVGSTLVEMYANFGSTDEGKSVFDTFSDHDIVLGNTLIAAYVHADEPVLALQLFEKMCHKGVKPDIFTFSCILKACGGLKHVETCRFMHDQILRNQYEHDVVVGNSLVDMYGKLCHMKESNLIFQSLGSRDIMSWNALITGYAQLEESLFILHLFQQMQEECTDPDNLTYACVLRACINIGALREGRLIHDQVMKNGLETETIIKSHLVELYANSSIEEGLKTFGTMQIQKYAPWNALIIGDSLHGNGLHSFEWFVKMQMEGIQVEKGTCVAVLKSCARHGALTLGQFVHNQLILNDFDIDLIIGSALIDMYGKCGSVEDACVLFDRLPSQDLASWNVMISGYTWCGDYHKAEICLDEMKKHGLSPDNKTYSNILSACSRFGKAAVGQHYFKSMWEDYDIIPDMGHFTCMVDLLSRLGHLDEAELLLKSVPDLPDIPGWRALLSACKSHGGMEIGRRCYLETTSPNPERLNDHVLMSSYQYVH